MTLSYRFLRGGQGVDLKVSGRLTLAEFSGVHTAIVSRDLTTQPLLYAWFEFGDEVSHVDISTAEINGAAKALIHRSPPQPIKRITAIYAKNNGPFARSQEWQSLIAPIVDAEVFRNRAVALEWLRKRVAERHEFQIEL